MKVIDLLNKIANRKYFEEKHIKFLDRINQVYDICMICEENIIYKLDKKSIELNDEIEIIEDTPNKIEKIGNDYYHKKQDEINEIFQRKLNEIIDYINNKENNDDE